MEGSDKKNEGEERIKALEEEVKRLKAERGKERQEESEGVAGSVLHGLGDVIPGLGGLIKGLEKSSAFREKLEAIDEEVDARLKGTPLKRVDIGGGIGRSRIPGSIPGRTVSKRAAARKVQRAPGAEMGVAGLREIPVDVFDEEDHVRVIAELPGIEEKDIKLDLKGDKLVISAERVGGRKVHQEIALPSMPQGDLKTTYKNGILEIRIEKNPEGKT